MTPQEMCDDHAYFGPTPCPQCEEACFPGLEENLTTDKINALDWKRCSDEQAPLDVEVMTKIDDALGCRNEQTLTLHRRSPEGRPIWFLPDLSMYVYYTPTHWARNLDNDNMDM